MAAPVDVRTAEGSVIGAIELDDQIFGIQPNVPVMHQVVTAQLAAARAGSHSTKTRAEVRGGGRKPFRQKGTGRARQGSIRAPHWSGGGVALGPKPRSYRQGTPRKMIQLALRSALSDRAAEERVVVVDEWRWSTPKTSEARRALAALALEGKVLIVLDPERHGEVYLSFRNLPNVQLLLQGELNAYDVLCNDWVVFTRSTLPGESAEVPASVPAPSDIDSAEVVEREAEGHDRVEEQEQPQVRAQVEGQDEVEEDTPEVQEQMESQDQPEVHDQVDRQGQAGEQDQSDEETPES
jgi:large subunit ribosomal protein L4